MIRISILFSLLILVISCSDDDTDTLDDVGGTEFFLEYRIENENIRYEGTTNNASLEPLAYAIKVADGFGGFSYQILGSNANSSPSNTNQISAIIESDSLQVNSYTQASSQGVLFGATRFNQTYIPDIIGNRPSQFTFNVNSYNNGIVEGQFSGRMYTSSFSDSIDITSGRFRLQMIY